MKGFTLIELVVVLGIISILSVLGVTNIIKFQENAFLDSTANQFSSTLRTARSKSMAGEVAEGETVPNFELDGLPQYGVDITSSGYAMVRIYKLAGQTNFQKDNLETYNLPSNFSFTSTGEVLFNRNTGNTLSAIYILQKDSNLNSRQIDITSEGLISITSI